MVDVMLMQSSSGSGRQVCPLIVGESTSFPSVGQVKCWRRHLIRFACAGGAFTECSEAAQSRIIISAHRINHGSSPISACPARIAISTS